MKKTLLLKTMLLLCAIILGTSAWADPVTVSMTSFDAISGNVGGDANISYEAAKGTAGTAPAVNNNEIRVYQNGGTFTITTNNGAKINSITLGSSMATTVTYSVDGGTASSNQSITAGGTTTVSNLNCSSVLFTCKGTDKNSRLYVNNLSVTYTAGAPLPTYTVTLGDDNTQLTEATGGAGVTLPVRGTLNGYDFAGWSETNVSTETTEAPTIIPAGAYAPTNDITLYPVYTKTKGDGGTTHETASVTIADYATANSWVSGTKYPSVTLDNNITATADGTSNTGKYYP